MKYVQAKGKKFQFGQSLLSLSRNVTIGHWLLLTTGRGRGKGKKAELTVCFVFSK